MIIKNPNECNEYMIRKAMEEGNINQAIAMWQYRMHEEINREREQQKMEERIAKKVLSAFSVQVENDTQKAIEDLCRSLEGLKKFGK